MPRTIPLTRGQVAIVDDEDYERLSKITWTFLHKSNSPDPNEGYATHYYREGKKVHAISMHRFLMNPPDELCVDHINGNGLDNRKSNLRLCTHSQNLKNRKPNRNKRGSKYKGVNPYGEKFAASICHNYTRIDLGVFDTEVQAASAYDLAASVYHGQFARYNFPIAQKAL